MKKLEIAKKPLYSQAHEQLLSELSLITRLVVYTGFAFFILSLLLTSLFTSGEDIQGYWILALGWIGLIIFQFSWFANPLNLLALLLVNQRPIVALLLSIVAFILASQTFIFVEIPTGTSSGKIHIKELGLGFYIWYLAQGLFLLGIIIEVFSHKKARTSLASS
ncbi:MAG: hypothetical protein L3J51_09815 [Cocleimonas sp.]|nr:hypothetical protein [Cocleimonas sp.]